MNRNIIQWIRCDAICMIITAEPLPLVERALPLFVWHQRSTQWWVLMIFCLVICILSHCIYSKAWRYAASKCTDLLLTRFWIGSKNTWDAWIFTNSLADMRILCRFPWIFAKFAWIFWVLTTSWCTVFEIYSFFQKLRKSRPCCTIQ